MVNRPRVRLVHMLPEVPEYQERPQIEQLREFWRSDTLRIAALVGIGGTGKTALVRRFLEELPGSAIVNPKVAKRADLSPPDGLFVWSFYSAPYVEEFFTEAFKFIRSCAPANVTLPELEEPRRATVFMVEEALRKVPMRFLFVLDGLEKVQSEGREGEEVGSLIDFPLKQFLTRIAEGCGNTKLLITSRYPLPDLERYRELFKDEMTLREHSPSFESIEDLDRLEPYEDPGLECEIDPAVDLLRALGVRGSDTELKQIADRFDRHALTVDLVGRWMKEFADGEATRVDEIPPLEEAARGLKGQGEEAEKISCHMERILRAFRERLSPGEVALLECLSVLRVPMPAKFLMHVFRHAPANTIDAVASLTDEQLLDAFRRLSLLGLIYRELDSRNIEWFGMHPVVRERFYTGLRYASELHYTIGDFLATITHQFQDRGTDNFSDLLLLDELIYHTVRSGQPRTAFFIYWTRTLRYPKLGRKLGAFFVGLKMLQTFDELPSLLNNESEKLGDKELGHLANEQGLFAQNVGRLREAAQLFSEAILRAKRAHDWQNVCIILQSLVTVWLALGLLNKACETAGESLSVAETLSDDKKREASLALRGAANAYKGHVEEAYSDFGAAENYEEPHTFGVLDDPGIRTLPGWLGVYHAWLLFRLGLVREAILKLHANGIISGELGENHALARVSLLLAEIHVASGYLTAALKPLQSGLNWGLSRGDLETFIWGQLVRARMSLAKGDFGKACQALHDGLVNARECGYGLYWIDLQVAKGQWELACGRQLREGRELPPELEIWTPQRWFERAEASALRALNGQLKDSGDPAPQPDLPENQLAMLGARHPECGYAWGEGDALHLLGEVWFELAQCIGPDGHDSGGRSCEQLLEKACRAAEEALALRKRIQDPKAKETRDLLRRIQECENDSR